MAIDWQSRRDGFDHRKYKPTDSPINWKYWGSLKDWKQWEACALSLSINPDNMKHHPQSWLAGPGSRPLFTDESFPSVAAKLEFDKRLTMFNRVARGNPLAVVSPAVFAAWCVHVGLAEVPTELLAMAAPSPTIAQESVPAQTATPAPVVATSDGPAPLPAVPNWKMRVQAEATELFIRLLASGANPTTHSIRGPMAQWCRENDIRTDGKNGGINPSENYLRTWVLGGNHWKPPTMSREQAIKHVAQVAHSKVAHIAQ